MIRYSNNSQSLPTRVKRGSRCGVCKTRYRIEGRALGCVDYLWAFVRYLPTLVPVCPTYLPVCPTPHHHTTIPQPTNQTTGIHFPPSPSLSFPFPLPSHHLLTTSPPQIVSAIIKSNQIKSYLQTSPFRSDEKTNATMQLECMYISSHNRLDFRISLCETLRVEGGGGWF